MAATNVIQVMQIFCEMAGAGQTDPNVTLPRSKLLPLLQKLGMVRDFKEANRKFRGQDVIEKQEFAGWWQKFQKEKKGRSKEDTAKEIFVMLLGSEDATMSKTLMRSAIRDKLKYKWSDPMLNIAFELLDVDKGLTIDVNEAKLGIEAIVGAQIFMAIDVSNDDNIDKDEFMAACEKMNSTFDREFAETTYKTLDEDGDGQIGAREFLQGFTGQNMNPKKNLLMALGFGKLIRQQLNTLDAMLDAKKKNPNAPVVNPNAETKKSTSRTSEDDKRRERVQKLVAEKRAKKAAQEKASAGGGDDAKVDAIMKQADKMSGSPYEQAKAMSATGSCPFFNIRISGGLYDANGVYEPAMPCSDHPQWKKSDRNGNFCLYWRSFQNNKKKTMSEWVLLNQKSQVFYYRNGPTLGDEIVPPEKEWTRHPKAGSTVKRNTDKLPTIEYELRSAPKML